MKQILLDLKFIYYKSNLCAVLTVVIGPAVNTCTGSS